MSVLIVVSHPDDEVLGCGATGSALAARGIPVRACILAGNVEIRGARPKDHELRSDIGAAQAILGFGEPVLGTFPNIRLNTVAQVELVQFIEQAIIDSAADIIFTHHPNDLNDDHLQTSRACQAAARLAQRRPGIAKLRRLFFMEVLSATDWSFRNGSTPFEPDAYFDASATLEKKISALAAYRGVMRPAPHPRSAEVLRGHAAYRGGQAGMLAAEAFQTAYAALNESDFD